MCARRDDSSGCCSDSHRISGHKDSNSAIQRVARWQVGTAIWPSYLMKYVSVAVRIDDAGGRGQLAASGRQSVVCKR